MSIFRKGAAFGLCSALLLAAGGAHAQQTPATTGTATPGGAAATTGSTMAPNAMAKGTSGTMAPSMGEPNGNTMSNNSMSHMSGMNHGTMNRMSSHRMKPMSSGSMSGPMSPNTTTAPAAGSTPPQ